MPHSTKFDPGFRLSALDCVILLVGAAASAGAAVIDTPLGVVIAFTVGHFFLFCNVVRMQRGRELIWAGTYVGLCSCALLFNVPSWFQVFAFTLALTTVVVAIEMRSPAYHGVFWKRINPSLEDWWRAHGGELS